MGPPTGPRADLVEARALDRSSERYEHYAPGPRPRDNRRSFHDDDVIDGSYGFVDHMDTDDGDNDRGKGLYSDDLVGARTGRGQGEMRDRGRGGRDRGRGYR